MRVALVEWTDAIADGEWITREAIAKLKAEPTKSVGFLARNDSGVVVLVQTENARHMGDVLVIPRGMVKRVRFLK